MKAWLESGLWIRLSLVIINLQACLLFCVGWKNYTVYNKVFEGLENRKNGAVPNYYNAENLAIKNKYK